MVGKAHVGYQERTWFAGTAIFGVAIALGVWMASCSPRVVERYSDVGREPNISPDYSGAVIPPNIAPLNFRILEAGQAYSLPSMRPGASHKHFQQDGSDSHPPGPWHALLDANRGRDISFDVYVQGADRQWRRFRPHRQHHRPGGHRPNAGISIHEALYSWWKDIGIYQRDLTNYETSMILHGRSFGEGCLNCHSFVGNDPTP